MSCLRPPVACMAIQGTTPTRRPQGRGPTFFDIVIYEESDLTFVHHLTGLNYRLSARAGGDCGFRCGWRTTPRVVR